ncbi:site-specific integrase [Denitratisoma sp. agr-D3]
MDKLYVKTIQTTSGERIPLLVDRDSGAPLFKPTVYALTCIRARNRASKTIESALRALQVFYSILGIQEIDLDARLGDGKVLEIGEIDELVRLSRLNMGQLRHLARTKRPCRPSTNIHSLESHRFRAGKAHAEVSMAVSAGRIRWICHYLSWLVSVRLAKLDSNSEPYQRLSEASKQATSALMARVTGVGDRNVLYLREGLAPEGIAELLRVTRPSAPENPWIRDYVRQRNCLLVRWLYVLGLRRGELLNVKIPDIDFRKMEVVVARRADDPEDPRLHQPKVKTKDRILPLSKELCQLTYDYVMTPIS